MNNADKSILSFGIYMVTVGILVMLIPNLLLSSFGLPLTNEVWIRLGGLLVSIVGGYYIQAVRYRLISFYRATVYGRVVFALGITLLIIFGYGHLNLILVAFLDAFAALTTAYLLKKEK